MQKELKNCPKMMEVAMTAFRYDTVNPAEIARLLGNKPIGTVRNNLVAFRRKLDADTTRQALHKADKLGLFPGHTLGDAVTGRVPQTDGKGQE